jgi:hypothetical protein
LNVLRVGGLRADVGGDVARGSFDFEKIVQRIPSLNVAASCMNADLARRKSVWDNFLVSVARIDSRRTDVATGTSDIDTLQSSKNETLVNIYIKLQGADR